MRKILLLLLLLAGLGWSQPPLVLVIGDLNQVDVTLKESQLRQRLRELREGGKLEAKLAGYNLALADHRKSLRALKFSPPSLPMLLVCTQNAQGLPLAVEWSTPVETPEAAVGELMEYLRQEGAGDTDEIATAPRLTMDDPSIQVGAQSGVINVKVRLSNAGTGTLNGPLKVLLWTQLPEQGWVAAGEQNVDKVPAGWNLTKDFFIAEAPELLNSSFTVKAQLLLGGTVLQEKTARRSFP